MNVLMFLAALVVITLGHFFRTRRWKSFISVYEDSRDSDLMFCTGIGYLVDNVLPFHVGDIVRAAIMGKKLKNGAAFSLAVIIIDRILDVFVVAFIFGTIFFASGKSLMNFIFFAGFSALLLLFLWLSVTFSKRFKKCVLVFSSIFNTKIQLCILEFVWSFICTIRNTVKKIDKTKLILRTFCMWSCYILSYLMYSKSLENTSFVEVFNNMFSIDSYSPFVDYIHHGFSHYYFIFLLFNFLTCVSIIVVAFFQKFKNKSSENKEELIIPYTNENSILDFLKIYFSDIRDKNYIDRFLEINKDVIILRNCSAGSNATTLQCIKNGRMVYRKYAFGNDGEKLFEQVKWLQSNKDQLYVTEILDAYQKNNVCYYDMPYLGDSIGLFDHIHSMPLESSWRIMKSVVSDLESNYSKKYSSKADADTIRQYYDKKIRSNIDKIMNAHVLSELTNYEKLVINGETYDNLTMFLDKLYSFDFWKEIFENDYYSDIHGDLTVENIVCNINYPKGYYLIDPNGGNIHSSPNLDYSKLLQSLHGNYEFFMHTAKVKVNKNEISFKITRTTSYDVLYKRLDKYLKDTFDAKRVKSIYFHEIVHWLRLMPYKINNDSDRAAMFYAGLVMVVNDIFEEFDNIDKRIGIKACNV